MMAACKQRELLLSQTTDVKRFTDSFNSAPCPHTFPYPSITFAAAITEFLLILHTYLIFKHFFPSHVGPFASTHLIFEFTLENEVLKVVHSA